LVKRQYPLGSTNKRAAPASFAFAVDLRQPLGENLPFLCDVVEGGHCPSILAWPPAAFTKTPHGRTLPGHGV
jgi:hypothetical protein